MSLARNPAALALATVMAVGLGACHGDVTSSARPPGAARFEIVSGNTQTALPGTELPQPVVVRVVDANGNPIAGQLVNFRVVSGDGSVFAGSALTTAYGLAKDYWTLGDDYWILHGGEYSAPEQRLEVRAVDGVTGEKQVFARLTAFALRPAKITATRVAGGDSLAFRAQFTEMTSSAGYKYVWDTGVGGGTWRVSGETPVSPNPQTRLDLRAPIVGTSGQYWFCYYVVNLQGERSGWMCSYFGPPPG